MTWMKFLLWLLVGYALYYAAIIIWDQLHSRTLPGNEVSGELTFVEHIEPSKEIPDQTVEDTGSAVVSSGGVSLKQAFNLAREEMIVYTRAVSF